MKVLILFAYLLCLDKMPLILLNDFSHEGESRVNLLGLKNGPAHLPVLKSGFALADPQGESLVVCMEVAGKGVGLCNPSCVLLFSWEEMSSSPGESTGCGVS